MSERIPASSLEAILSTRADETPWCDEAVQNRSRASTEMMLARPRSYELESESLKAEFETGTGDGEDSQYHFASPANMIASTNTVVHITPIENKYYQETQGRKPRYEIVQNGLKFKGNVKGIKITASQVTSKTGQYTAEYHQSGYEKQNHRSQGKHDNGFVNQSGALFFQSVTNSETEVSQHVGGKDLYKVKQDAVEVEGEAVDCAFNNIDQRVW